MSDQSYKYKYDVFLSFRGQDIGDGFTGQLWKALNDDKGIHTFMDNSIHGKGEEISPTLLRAIEQSRIAIIVFSRNYASSSWCLDELCKILERNKEKGILIFSVFYDVDPSDVRHQRGPYGEAFETYEKKFKVDKEKVRKWRDALAEVANFFGWVYRNQPKYQLIQVIVEHVFQNLDRIPLPKIDYVVGIESRIQEVLPLLELESNYDGTLMMGIYGPPGIGKTILAAVICNRIKEQFEAFCFLDNLGKDSRLRGLVHLQNILLSKMIEEKDSNLTSVDVGALRIKNRLQQKKVLVILDDVDTLEQLEALAGKPDWFGPGSRVIVTTRDRHLLAFHGIEISYEVQPLNHKDALQLLSHQVFKQGNVDPAYTEILNELVSYASGLPLALKVVGSFLFGKSVEKWESALQRFKRIPPYELQNILKISFDALKEEEKSVFLDIACCFQGYKLSTVLEILSAHHDDDYVNLHVDVLIEKSLLSVNSDGKVTLHPLTEDMGKNIVHQENSKQSGNRSRLWYPEDIIEVLQNNTGTSSIEMIHLDSPLVKDGEAIEWDGEAFKKMENLRTLIIRNCKFSQAPQYLPESLRVLEWQRYPLNEFPSDFNPNQLLICKLPHMSFNSLELAVPKALQSHISQVLQSSPNVPNALALQDSPRNPRHPPLYPLMDIFMKDYKNNIWRVVGLMSSVVGLSCFALSPSFCRLIRGWNAWKFILYEVFCLVVLIAFLSAEQSTRSVGHVWYKIKGFAILMFIAVYTLYYDKAVNGKPEILTLVSNAAFVLMSLCYSKLTKYAHEMGVFSFFLSCFTVQLWIINRMLIFVAICFGFPLFVLHPSSDPRISIHTAV